MTSQCINNLGTIDPNFENDKVNPKNCFFRSDASIMISLLLPRLRLYRYLTERCMEEVFRQNRRPRWSWLRPHWGGFRWSENRRRRWSWWSDVLLYLLLLNSYHKKNCIAKQITTGVVYKWRHTILYTYWHPLPSSRFVVIRCIVLSQNPIPLQWLLYLWTSPKTRKHQ